MKISVVSLRVDKGRIPTVTILASFIVKLLVYEKQCYVNKNFSMPFGTPFQ